MPSFSSAATRKRSPAFRARPVAQPQQSAHELPACRGVGASRPARRGTGRGSGRTCPQSPIQPAPLPGRGGERQSDLPGAARARRRRHAQGGRGGMISPLAGARGPPGPHRRRRPIA